jgi:hypothetical protein
MQSFDICSSCTILSSNKDNVHILLYDAIPRTVPLTRLAVLVNNYASLTLIPTLFALCVELLRLLLLGFWQVLYVIWTEPGSPVYTALCF